MTILFKLIETIVLIISMPILLTVGIFKIIAAFFLMTMTRIFEIWSSDASTSKNP